MTLGLRTLLEDRRGQFLTLDLGKIDAALFKDAAFTHHP